MSESEAEKRLRYRQIFGIRLSLGSIMLMIFCAFLLVLSTFIKFNLTHYILPLDIFDETVHHNPSDFLKTVAIIPQIPVVMFIGAMLGRKYGITSILMYILAGLFILPVFALGGGPGYIFEYSFGYIVGYIPAVFFAGSILKSGFTYRNIAQAVLVGVLTIHIIGIFYMLFLAGLKHEGIEFIQGWIIAQSGWKIVYDFILSFLLVLVAKYARLLLWIFM